MVHSINERQDVYERLSRALIKAYKFYEENHEETIDIMLKYVKIDRDVLTSETYDGNFSPNPNPGKERIKVFWDKMNEIKYIESDIDIEDHINTEIYTNALESLLKENPDDPVYLKLKEELTE